MNAYIDANGVPIIESLEKNRLAELSEEELKKFDQFFENQIKKLPSGNFFCPDLFGNSWQNYTTRNQVLLWWLKRLDIFNIKSRPYSFQLKLRSI